jgi:hypothetical protein
MSLVVSGLSQSQPPARFRLYLFLLIIVQAYACGGLMPPSSSKPQMIRLSRVWQSPSWFSVGAINQRGPLHILLATTDDFKRLNIEAIPWIHPSVLPSLKLATTINLQGQSQTPASPLILDGLSKSMTINFTVLREAILERIPFMIDAIIPIEQVLKGDEATDLIVSTDGYLMRASTLHSIPKSNSSLLYRFQELFDPQATYPDLLVAERIDYKDHIKIRWKVPQIELPKNIWIVSSLNPKVPEQGPIVGIRIKKKRRPILINPMSPIRDDLIDQTYPLDHVLVKQTCPPHHPCPIRLKDIMRTNRPCHHDLCMITLATHPFALKPKDEAKPSH